MRRVQTHLSRVAKVYLLTERRCRVGESRERSAINRGGVAVITAGCANDVSVRSLLGMIYTGYSIHLQTALRKLIRPGSLLATDFASSSQPGMEAHESDLSRARRNDRFIVLTFR